MFLFYWFSHNNAAHGTATTTKIQKLTPCSLGSSFLVSLCISFSQNAWLDVKVTFIYIYVHSKTNVKMFCFFFFGSILKEMSFCPYLSYKDLVIISLKRSSFSSPYISKENFKCCWPWTNCFTFLCLSLSVLSSIIIPNTAAVPFMVVRWKLVSHVQNQSHLQNSPWHTPTLSFICQALQFPVGFGMCLFLGLLFPHRP